MEHNRKVAVFTQTENVNKLSLLNCGAPVIFILIVIAVLFINQQPLIFRHKELEIKLPIPFIENNSTSNYSYNEKMSRCEEFNKNIIRRGYSQSGCRGRIGNQLGVMAFGLQFHLRFGIKLLVDSFQYNILNKVFEMDYICKQDGTTFCFTVPEGCLLATDGMKTVHAAKREQLWKKGLSFYGEMPSELEGKIIQLYTYPQFLTWIIEVFLAEFRERMKFQQKVISGANLIVNKTREEFNCSISSSCVLVVVHMRIEDYPRSIGPTRTELMEKSDYLPTAFNYVEKQHYKPLFLVVGHTSSDVSAHFRKHAGQYKKHTIVQAWQLEEKSSLPKDILAGVDFAILGLADVVILTYGSYGDFGALFGRDKIAVYYPLNHPSHDETGVNNGLPRFKGIPWKVLKN